MKKTRKKFRVKNISLKDLIRQRWFVIVCSLILTGLGAALTGVLFKTGYTTLDKWRISLTNVMPPLLILPLLGATGGFISGTLITNISPSAEGSGITHIMAYLRHKSVPMGLKVGLVKLVAGIIAIGSGFPLGPEGPAVQMGGSVAWKMARWLKAPVSFRRVIVAAGGGAGIAAIFSAPIGGFIYAIEELLNSAKPIILLLVVITTFWADTWADIIGSLGLSSYKLTIDNTLGFPLEREYTPFINFLPIDVGYLIVLGILIGILAELYCLYVIKMQIKVKEYLGNRLALKMTITGSILGLMYSFIPKEFIQSHKIQDLIADGSIDIRMAIMTFIILFLSTGLAAASGAPGGLFAPMLTLGGAIGFAFGGYVETITGHIPTTYIFAGMGAFVASCSRTPVSAMFLAFALTKDLVVLKPILITCLASFLVARVFNDESIYHRQLNLQFTNTSSIDPKGNNKRLNKTINPNPLNPTSPPEINPE